MYIIIVLIGQYQQLISQSFSNLKRDNDDLKGTKKRMVDEVKEMRVKRDKRTSVTTRLRRALETMTQQVCIPLAKQWPSAHNALQSKAFSRCEDILIMGAVMNLGGDRKADGHSAFFCGSELAQEVINDHRVNLQSIVTKAITLVRLVFLFLC